MKKHDIQFLDPEPEFTQFDSSAMALLPVPYEGGISYGQGTGSAPEAILNASHHVELYDEVLRKEPYRIGLATTASLADLANADKMNQAVEQAAGELIDAGKFVIGLGGDHSITPGICQAFYDRMPELGVVQLDAHADLRTDLDGDPQSHGCTMHRIREFNKNTLQIGIQSLSREEGERIQNEDISLCTMYQYRKGMFNVEAALAKLPEHVYLTLDVDVFDWNVIRSTGTPEPGGFSWPEGLSLIKDIFFEKTVVGFDVVELSARKDDPNSAFAAARLIYKLIGFKVWKSVYTKQMEWPQKPAGNIFSIV